MFTGYKFINNILFVDTKVENYQSLITDVATYTKVVVIEPDADGVKQIADVLSSYSNLDSIQILSHGNVANVNLGSSSLNDTNIINYTTELKKWGEALSETGDILFYGCNVAEGETGNNFIEQLSDLTGADIAASTDVTGSSRLGGDWVLEFKVGEITTQTNLSDKAMASYSELLAAPPFTAGADPLTTAGATTGAATYHTVVGIDYDNDGDRDYLSDNGTKWVFYQNNGSGTYTPVIPNVTFYYSITESGVFVSDFDSDGDDDIAITNGTGIPTYYSNNGSGTFTAGTNPLTTAGAITGDATTFWMFDIDYDNDGDTDYVSTNTGNTKWAYYQNNGNGTFTEVAINLDLPYTTQTRYSFLVDDYDSDGDQDIMVFDGVSSPPLYYANDGTGSLTLTTNPLTTAGATTGATTYFSIVGLDADSDGDRDFIADNGTAYVYYINNGSGSYTAVTPNVTFNYALSTQQQSNVHFLIEDINSDGDDDILMVDGTGIPTYFDQNNAPPKITSFTPADNSTGIDVASNIVLNFNETINSAGTGTIKIFKTSDNSLIESIAGNDAKVTGVGTSTITINPAATLTASTQYYIQISSKAFYDIDGMTYNHTNTVDKTSMSFTTGTAGPTITSATYDASTNSLLVTGTGMTATGGAANDINVAKLTLTGQGGATYNLTSSNVEIASATSFTVALNTADQAGVEGLLNKDSTNAVDNTLYNIAAAADWNPSQAGNADATGNGVTVSNVQKPTITSSTYDASTGALLVTGANLVNASGATNDITANKFTFTGEGGATYTLTDTANVELASASTTYFTLNLSATDKAAVNQIINKNSTVSTSGQTYNLATTDDWNTVINPAAGVDISDTTATINASNVAVPAITSATYNASTGALVVTGTGFPKKSGAANDIDVTKFTFTGAGTTYTLTANTTNVEITSGTTFTVSLGATDKAELNQIINKDGTASTDTVAYNLNAAEDWAVGADVATTTTVDATGNAVTASGVAVPAITSSTYDASAGTLVVTGTGFLKASGATNDIDVTKLTFTAAGTTYTLTGNTSNVDITSGTSFTVTLGATDKAALNKIINKDGTASTDTVAYNLAAAENWAAGAIAATDADLTGNAVTASNVAVPAVTSITYDYNTNVMTVTGTNFLSKSGANNDIDLTKLTISGEAGGTYTLTNATGVEITSATAFSTTLTGTDLTNVEALLNNDGATAATGATYNLNAAEDWAAGANAAVNVVDATGNGITVSNYAVPTVTSAAYDYSNGQLVVTGTNFVSASGATNDVVVNTLVITGEGGAQYQLTSASNVEVTSATSYTVTIAGADLTFVEGLLNKSGTTSATAGTTFSLISSEDWMAGSPAANNVADAAATITVSNYAMPAVSSATYDSSTNVLVVTGTNFISQSGANNDIDVSMLTLTGEGGTTYTLTTATDIDITSATAFSVTLTGADLVNVETVLNKNGTTSATAGTTYNLAAADNWAFQAPAATNIADTTAGVTVSNYANPAITSTTYDWSTGVLVLTGTNFVGNSGATNDITANTLTLTGEGGATYTLTGTANVEISSATAATVTLSDADKLAINGLLNKDGTTSATGTTFNVAAADNWMAGAPAANNIADTTAGVTVSNYATPTVTSVTYDYNTNVLTVTGTNFVSKSGGANDIDLTKLTITGEGGVTYTLTNATGVEITSATAFSTTLTGADLTNVEALLNQDGTTAVSTATYNLAAADNWLAQAPTGTDITDATGNGITVSNYTAPTITSATYDWSNGNMVIAGTNFVSNSGATNDIAANLLTLTGEGGTYTLTDTANVEITSATAATLTLSATDQLNINGLLNKNGTTSSGVTTYNLAAAEDWMAGTAAATNVVDLTGNGITVSNVATPTITSAAYDIDTGIMIVTGTDFFSKVGATNDIDLSMLTFTGGTGNATYTLTTATDVEITSATSFSLTLSGTDKTQIDALLDQIGTSSAGGSTYNIAGADNWLTGADAATNIADAAGNALTVSVNPKITSATYNAGTGSLVVTGVNIQAKAGVTNDITANTITLTGEGGATYTLTDTANVERTSVTAFTLALSATDKAALNQIMNKAGITSTGGTTFNIAAADNWNANVTAGDTSDTTGNAVTVSNVAAPAITSTTYDANTGALVLSGTGFLSKNNGGTDDIVANKFTFTGEGGATHTLTDTANVEITSGTAATLTLSAADKAAVNQIVNKNGTASTSATTYNINAAEDWAAGADATVNVVDATNAITASNVAVPAITSTAYNASTGALVVSGTGFLSKGIGGADDIIANKFTFTGEGGATYTLTDTANVDITSGTAFTITLSATDKAGINQMVNKDGTTSTSGTTYNINAAEDWAAGANVAVNVVDATGNAITASNVAIPAIASSTYDANTGALVVTGTGFLGVNGVTNDIIANKFTMTGAGTSYTLTDTANVEVTSTTAFTLTLSAADKAALNLIINKNGTTSTDTIAYNLAAAEDWAAGADAAVNVVDTTATITASNVAVPAITSTTYDASTGALVVTGTNFLTKSGATNDIVANKFTFTGEGGATYTLTDSSNVEITSATAFTITLSATDKDAVNQMVNKIGTASTSATTYNINAAEDWAGGAEAAVNVVDTTNAITASNVAVPTITSATYNTGSAVLAVTGTGFLSITGAINDIDVTKLTITGEAGATHTLTSTAVEISSGTAFSVTLNAADKTAVNALLNKDGTTSTDVTTYNLAAAEDWAAGADAAVNVVDATGNGITNTIYVAPAPSTPATPATPPVTTQTTDGVSTTSTTTTTGTTTTTTVTVPIVTDTRQEDPNTENPTLADIPVATNAAGDTIIEVGVPVGVGFTSQTVTSSVGSTLRDTLIGSTQSSSTNQTAIDAIINTGIDHYVPTVNNEAEVTVRTITFTEITTVPTVPIVINGATGTGEDDASNPNRQEALVINAGNLPSGTILDLNNVEFAIVVGVVQLTGGNGRNFVIGDEAAQYIVLGADDDELHGGAGDDVIGSKGGNDLIFGDEGNDKLFGGDGDDTLNGGTGNDNIKGGKHSDTVVMDGSSDQYTVETIYGKTLVTSIADPSNVDTVINAEKLQFTDKTIDITSSEDLSWIATLYQQVLGRQADIDGFQNWSAVNDTGEQSKGYIAVNFIRSAEYQNNTEVVFDNLSSTEQIEMLYNKMFIRQSDAEGLANWENNYNNGMSIEDIATYFVNSPEMKDYAVTTAGWDFFF